jgi:hypothetical protein
MSVHAKQELDLTIGVAFSRLMTKAYLDMAKEKFRLVAEIYWAMSVMYTVKKIFVAKSLQPAHDHGLPGHGLGEV